jgi:hypothetical protein
MKTKTSILSAGFLALVLALPVVQANAATPTNEVTVSMQEAKATAYQLSENADRLHAITRSGGHSWQSHSGYLDSVREDVNQLGKMLSNLEDLKAVASPSQQLGIERMRPQLVQTADSLENAIQLLNERRHHVYFSEYGDAVETVSQQAASMHQTLDAVLDYESAKARLDGLELSAGS